MLWGKESKKNFIKWLHQQDTYKYLPEIRKGHIFDSLDEPTSSLYWRYAPDFIDKSLEVKSRKHLGRSTFSELCYIVFYSVVLLYWGCNYCSYSFTHIPVLSCSEKKRKKDNLVHPFASFFFFSSALYPPFSIFSSQINSNICY